MYYLFKKKINEKKNQAEGLAKNEQEQLMRQEKNQESVKSPKPGVESGQMWQMPLRGPASKGLDWKMFSMLSNSK